MNYICLSYLFLIKFKPHSCNFDIYYCTHIVDIKTGFINFKRNVLRLKILTNAFYFMMVIHTVSDWLISCDSFFVHTILLVLTRSFILGGVIHFLYRRYKFGEMILTKFRRKRHFYIVLSVLLLKYMYVILFRSLKYRYKQLG